MAGEFERVDIWMGHFPSQRRFDAYFKESYRRQSGPISKFAASQEEEFYDHDFVERQYFDTPSSDVRRLLDRFSFSDSYVEAVAAKYPKGERGPFNSVITACGLQFAQARSVEGEDFNLSYLGGFSSDPKTDSAWICRRSGPPDVVHLQLIGSSTPQAPLTVVVDRRGLTVGSGGSSSDTPYLDLSPYPGAEAVAPLQALIYRDQFDNWIVQDRAANGLTSVGRGMLNDESSAPWHRTELAFGGVKFLWNCFPDEEE